MSEKTNLSSSAEIEKRLNEINETLSSISAKEVLFIITLSFLAVFAAINMCLLILERRKKRKQNSVPQSIVIQPNNAKSDGKSGRNEKSKMSSGYEKDVLPSKSMKMKVAISPGMSVSKKARVQSKESVTEESQLSKTDTSQTEKNIKKPLPLPTTPTIQLPPQPENAASADVTTAVEPPIVIVPPPASSSSNPPPLASIPPPTPASIQPTRVEASQSNESSMTSFTAPEDPSSVRSKGGISIPKNATTPSATTLSGVSSNTSAQPELVKSTDAATAKDVSQVKSPMTPIRTPEVPANPSNPAVSIPLNTSTPPPNSEKKI